MKKQEKKTTEQEASAVTFLLPCYDTPLLTSDFLYGANQLGCFVDTPFVLLLELRDPRLNVYKEMVNNLIKKGMNVGYLIFDGTPYCGKINRVAHILNTKAICVLDNTHLPMPMCDKPEPKVTEEIALWQQSILEPMTIGVFDEMGNYPVISKKLIERLGYMFHPLSYGRESAENWLCSLGNELGLISRIPDFQIMASKTKEIEIAGQSLAEDKRWVEGILGQIFDEEKERINRYMVR